MILNSQEIKDKFKVIFALNFVLKRRLFLPINNIFRMEVEKCGCNFGCIKTSLGLFESLLLLNMIHQITTVYELHHKIQPTGSLKSRIKFSQKRRLKKVLKIVVCPKKTFSYYSYIRQIVKLWFKKPTFETVKSRLIFRFYKRPLLRQLKTVHFSDI